MRVAVFTSNQPRHVALLERLARVADSVVAVQECTTLLPGSISDFYGASPDMRRYFERVRAAERTVFGAPRPAPAKVRVLAMRMGDLSHVPLESLSDALACERLVVFGASYIRGALCDVLVERGAINIHMGVAPHYRGSSTNFWALYDGRPELVGATLHLLSAGLDSGPILRHAFPRPTADPFELGMRAVESAHAALAAALREGGAVVPQDRRRQIRYTRNRDFTDAAAREYLSRLPSAETISERISARDPGEFVRPFVGGRAGCAESASARIDSRAGAI